MGEAGITRGWGKSEGDTSGWAASMALTRPCSSSSVLLNFQEPEDCMSSV